MTDRFSRRAFLQYGAGVAAGSMMPLRGGAQHAAPLPIAVSDFELEESTIPQLHAVLETNPDALVIADRLDAERKAGRVRGAMHGIPVLVKDNIATGDHMMTTAGSLALTGVTPPRDAPLIARLRAAGAVILGKTNL